MSISRRTKSAVAVALAIALTGQTALADPKPEAKPEPTPAQVEEARQHFARGVELYKEGDYQATILELRRAYSLAPNYRILFNLGQTLMILQQYAGARDAFQRYLEEGGSQIPAARRQQVEEELKKLETRVGKLEVKSNVEDGEVAIDDEVVGKTPIEKPLDVSAGRRKVTLSHPRGSITRYVEVVGTETGSVDLTIADNTAPPPQAAPAVAVQRDELTPTRPHRSAAPWISLGITALLTGGAVTTGLLALDGKNDLERRVAMRNPETQWIDSARDRAENFGLAADLLGAAAIIGAGVTTYLFVTQPSSSPRVGMGITPGGASLGGSF